MKLTFFFLFIFIFNESYCQLGKIYPTSETINDSSLMEFISELKLATEKRDKKFIEKSLAVKTYIPFEGGEETSKEKFLEYYFGQQNSGGILWDNLDYIFHLGGGGYSETKDKYYLPYTSANIPKNDKFASFGVVLALSDSVPVFELPSINSDIITYLSFDAVEVSMESYREDFIEIILNLTDTLYVKSDDIVPTLSIRAGLIKENGEWKLEYADAFE